MEHTAAARQHHARHPAALSGVRRGVHGGGGQSARAAPHAVVVAAALSLSLFSRWESGAERKQICGALRGAAAVVAAAVASRHSGRREAD